MKKTQIQLLYFTLSSSSFFPAQNLRQASWITRAALISLQENKKQVTSIVFLQQLAVQNFYFPNKVLTIQCIRCYNGLRLDFLKIYFFISILIQRDTLGLGQNIKQESFYKCVAFLSPTLTPGEYFYSREDQYVFVIQFKFSQISKNKSTKYTSNTFP